MKRSIFRSTTHAKILFFLALIFFFSIAGWNPQLASADDTESIYTVQVGSYTNESDAESAYNLVTEKLPSAFLPFLRIEHIGAYYSVRIGKSLTQGENNELLNAVQKIAPGAMIRKAYYRQKRITKLYEVSEEKPTLVVATQEQIQPPPKQKHEEYYTLQLGTYSRLSDAKEAFQILSKKLPSEAKSFLRIEKINNLHVARLGRSTQKETIQKLAQQLAGIVEDFLILKGYYLEERILQITESDEKIAPAEPKSQAQSVTKRPSQTETADKNDIPQPPPTVIPAPEPQPTIRAPRATAPEQTATTLQAVEKMLMNKYLGDTSGKKQAQHKAAQERTMRFPEDPSCLSQNCHADMLSTLKQQHLPVQQARCSACHTSVGNSHPSGSKDFQVPLEDGELCEQCHEQDQEKQIRHAPYAEGSCLICHLVHGGAEKFMLKAEDGAVETLCYECHDRGPFNREYKHGPVGMGNCTLCHNPHASTFEKLLLDRGEKLCFNCHTNFVENLNEAKYQHTALSKGGCLSCHQTHSSQEKNLLSKAGDTFCYSCHQELEQRFLRAKTKHAGLFLEDQCSTCHLAHYSENKSLLVTDEFSLCLSCHSEGNKVPSYSPPNVKGELESNEYLHGPLLEKQCTPCHNPHASEFIRLLKGAYPTSFYSPYKTENYSFCYLCHDEQRLLAEQGEDATQFRNGNQNLHTLHLTIEKKGRTCRSCHNHHASDGPRLISRTGEKFGDWTMSIDFFITATGGSCMPGCHREMAYDRENPVVNETNFSIQGEPYIDYQSK